jgi:hypothetical protein
MRKGARACLIAILAPLAQAAAQVIPVKTVRIAEGDQFGFLPSVNIGMAGVSIAVHDTARDPFTNPAKAARLTRGSFFGSPSIYAVSNDAGGARTLPLGAIVKRGSSFGAFAVAMQEISTIGPRQDNNFGAPQPLGSGSIPPFNGGVATMESRSNRYGYAMLGHEFTGAQLSVAASAMWSGLNATDGVELLYPRSSKIKQQGDAMDLRLGLLKSAKGGGRSLEAVFLHSAYSMKNDVDFLEFFWDPARRQPMPRTWSEQHADRTQMYGAHLGYEQRLRDSTWRVGAILTGNRTWHPEMVNYSVMNLGRNPGNSSAFNAGVGVSKKVGATTYGADAIYEPVWSHAWETARVNDNRFRFDNQIVRLGASHEYALDAPGTSLRMQLGIQLRRVAYELDQRDSTAVMRQTHDGWNEWTHAWGIAVRLAKLEINYQARLQSGVGRPPVPQPSFFGFGFGLRTEGAALLAPAPPVTTPSLVPVRVATQQFSISIPIR